MCFEFDKMVLHRQNLVQKYSPGWLFHTISPLLNFITIFQDISFEIDQWSYISNYVGEESQKEGSRAHLP